MTGGMTECAAKMQKSPTVTVGDALFYEVLRGSHLPAHTWASRPLLQGFFGSVGIKTPPLLKI